MNSDFMQEQSRAFAERLNKKCGRDQTCSVDAAWTLALSRPPSLAEQKLAKTFFSGGGNLADMCLALLNRNEFVYVQ
jgi:hypothetical protein